MHGFSVEKGKQLSLMQLSLSSSQDENFSVFGGDFLFVFFYLESPWNGISGIHLISRYTCISKTVQSHPCNSHATVR